MKKYFFAFLIICAVMVSSCTVPRATGPYREVKSQNNKEVKAPPLKHKENLQYKEEDIKAIKDKQVKAPSVRKETFRIESSSDAKRISVFNVVIGSFSNRQNAVNLKKDQQPEYNPILAVNERGMFRVILISYSTYDEAKIKVNEIQDKFPDAWILVQKK